MKLYYCLIALFFITLIKADSEKFILITMLYNEKNHSRIDEYLTCLNNNLKHPNIEKVHILYDVSSGNEGKILQFIKKEKISFTIINERISFLDCFNLANNIYPNRKIILCNADIYFDETVDLLRSFNLFNTCIVLTRWNVLQNGTLKIESLPGEKPNGWSHDAWIFETPIITSNRMEIKLGTIGCDAAIAYELLAHGFNVINPCLSVKAIHLHKSKIHHYPNFNYYDKETISIPWITLT